MISRRRCGRYGDTITDPHTIDLVMLSYRHAFHAGNHADVLKHFLLVEMLRYYNRKDKPWWYVDTHAGAGCYALHGAHAEQTGEYTGGIGRLWGKATVPEAFTHYLDAVKQFNSHGSLTFYPGSPAIAMTQLRAQDRMRLFELHPSDFDSLEQTFARDGDRVIVRKADGFGGMRSLLPPPTRRAVVLIDPSYEIKQDYRQVVKRFPEGTFAVWYPMIPRPEARLLPDRLKQLDAGSWLDVRLAVRKPSTDGFGMFGSGLHIINPPWILPEVLEHVMPWLVDTLGEDEHAAFGLEHEIA